MEHRGYKILIVEDDPIYRQMLSDMLSSDIVDKSGAGHPEYTAIKAETGFEALEKSINELPDLILLDILLPDMSGFDVLSRLKESIVTSAIPVIIISGLKSIEDEEKGLLLGAVDYIAKPFHESLTMARINIHLKGVDQLRLIEQFSFVDHLTSIPNRRAFDKQMEIEWKRSIREKTPISIIMLDLDHFKIFNDTYGHQQGDRMLKTVASLMKLEAKRPTDLAVRWGGEEFIVLLPGTNIDGAAEIAERIRDKTEKTVIIGHDGKTQMNITVSLGVASITPGLDDKIEDFIERVDVALYTAKRTGRNRVCF